MMLVLTQLNVFFWEGEGGKIVNKDNQSKEELFVSP